MFQVSLMGVSMKYQGCFMQFSWIGSFKVVSRVLQGCFKGVSRVFQRSSEDDSRKFQSCLDEVSMVFLESFKGAAKSFWFGNSLVMHTLVH